VYLLQTQSTAPIDDKHFITWSDFNRRRLLQLLSPLFQTSRKMATFEIDCCVRGYHVSQRLWTSTVGENLSCRWEPTNENDRYAVVVMNDYTVIGHIPRKFSHVCSLFLRRRGNIICVATGKWRYSVDLPRGWLEIPCKLIFSAKPNKLRKLVHQWMAT